MMIERNFAAVGLGTPSILFGVLRLKQKRRRGNR